MDETGLLDADLYCEICQFSCDKKPIANCTEYYHWQQYSFMLEKQRNYFSKQLELNDDDRDRFDVAEWLENYPKTEQYTCHGCQRDYQIPTHLVHFSCLCGHRCRLRHVGGHDSYQAVIDAAISYFGTERQAQLAWLAEVFGSDNAVKYTADEMRKTLKRELDAWILTEDGWKRK